MRRFWVGEALLTEAGFTDPVTGVAVAVTGVRLRYRRVGGTLVEVDPGDITNPSTGVYRATITPADAGQYWLRWDATGPDGAVVEQEFELVASAVLS